MIPTHQRSYDKTTYSFKENQDNLLEEIMLKANLWNMARLLSLGFGQFRVVALTSQNAQTMDLIVYSSAL